MRNYQDSLFGALSVLRGKILAVTPHAHWGTLMGATQRGLGWQTLGLWVQVKSLGQCDNPISAWATSERTHDSAEPQTPDRNGSICWKKTAAFRPPYTHKQERDSDILSRWRCLCYVFLLDLLSSLTIKACAQTPTFFSDMFVLLKICYDRATKDMSASAHKHARLNFLDTWTYFSYFFLFLDTGNYFLKEIIKLLFLNDNFEIENITLENYLNRNQCWNIALEYYLTVVI